MKKKFSLWLNIVTICLCVCAIAIGVYAATRATITVSGQVGFVAHGVDMTINGTLSGYVLQSEQNTATVTRTRTLNTVTLGGENKIKEGVMSFADSTGTQAGTDVYFTDLVLDNNGNVPSIVMSLTLTNTSLFKVKATIDVSVLSTETVTASANKASIIFDAQGGAKAQDTLDITFTLENADNSITTPIDLSLVTTPIIVFDKYSVRSLLEFDETHGYYIEMGTENGQIDGTPLRWFPFAYSSDGTTFSAHTLTTQELPAGSYYFISEKILLGTVEWGTFSSSNTINYGLDYGTSSINALVNGQDEGSVYLTYGMANSPAYNEITIRNELPGESYNYYLYDFGGEYPDPILKGTYTTNPTYNQTLWLLECGNEARMLIDSHGDNLAYPIGGLEKLVSWSRSPVEVISGGVAYVSYLQEMKEIVPSNECRGVRPAFQLDIA